MSIKFKLSLCISLLVATILLLNISITYFSTQSGLQKNAEQRMESIAKQVGASIQSTQQARAYIESALAEKLRASAIAVQSALDPDIDQVTNEELVALSRKLDLAGISLWRKNTDNIVVEKSSEPSEIGLGSKTMDYWYKAFQQLFALEPVTVSQGQSLTNYWSGPINFATSNPSVIMKWGSYYDGTTNYMIDPYLHADVFLDFQQTIGTEGLIKQLLQDNPDILEITGFDPQFFGKAPIIKMKKGKPVYNLDVRDIAYGEYTYEDSASDKANVDAAISTGKMVVSQPEVNGKQLIKNFIPVHSDKDYVVGVSFDRASIRAILTHQLFVNITVSLGLLAATIILSYVLSAFLIRPLHQILRKVNAVAAGRFDIPMPIHGHDELGLLASRINTMSDNLSTSTTKMKEGAEELRSTKQYLESFVNQTSDAIHVVDLNGKLIQVNKAFETMYGWHEEEAIGASWPAIPEDLQEAYGSMLVTVLNGGAVAGYETTRYRKDGTAIDVSMTISSIRDEAGTTIAIASISRNISIRKQTEEALRRSEKLSMVGQLAAGVAHEIRNPLTTLRGFIQLQQRTGPLSPTHLDMMLSELDRINFIVGQFLVLSKPTVVHFQLTDIREIMRETVSLLEAQAIMNNVQLELKADARMPLLQGEPNQLKQVFLNVLKNGMEAMPGGGALRIELAAAPTPWVSSSSDAQPLAPAKEQTGEQWVRAAVSTPLSEASNSHPPGSGMIVVIRITDEGCGISEQELRKLGEPFYSSKPSGHGLGLMVSQQILDNHKGSITYRSKIGEGTCVEIRLPANGAIHDSLNTDS